MWIIKFSVGWNSISCCFLNTINICIWLIIITQTFDHNRSFKVNFSLRRNLCLCKETSVISFSVWSSWCIFVSWFMTCSFTYSICKWCRRSRNNFTILGFCLNKFLLNFIIFCWFSIEWDHFILFFVSSMFLFMFACKFIFFMWLCFRFSQISWGNIAHTDNETKG
jgi:hypothetical protein